jgi:preprotein translocase subunit SecF
MQQRGGVLSRSIIGRQRWLDLPCLMAMQCIMKYSSFRSEWRTASGALLALVRDVVFVLAFLRQAKWNQI